MSEVWWPMKQRAHIEQCKLQYIELQLTQKCVTLKNRAARRTGGQQKPADKPRGCLSFGRNSKCIMIAVNSKWLIATHINTHTHTAYIGCETQRQILWCRYTISSRSPTYRPTVVSVDSSISFYWHLWHMEQLGSWIQLWTIGTWTMCNTTCEKMLK